MHLFHFFEALWAVGFNLFNQDFWLSFDWGALDWIKFYLEGTFATIIVWGIIFRLSDGKPKNKEECDGTAWFIASMGALWPLTTIIALAATVGFVIVNLFHNLCKVLVGEAETQNPASSEVSRRSRVK